MFEKTTWIKLPRTVLVGHGVLGDLPAAVEDLYLSGSPLLVTSPTPNELVGDGVREAFPDVETVVIETAGFDAVERVVDAASAAESDYLIALGGGKPIDTAKMASDRLSCGFVSVPTAASHDGMVVDPGGRHPPLGRRRPAARGRRRHRDPGGGAVGAHHRGVCRHHLELHRSQRLAARPPAEERGVQRVRRRALADDRGDAR